MTASTISVDRVRRLPPETILLVAVIVLVAAGLLVVFDTSFPLSLNSSLVGNDPLYFGKQQAKGLFLGVLAATCAVYFGYHRLRSWSGLLLSAGGTLLVLVLFPHFGIMHLNARRWIHLGVTFQPSEVAKLTLVLFLAALLSKSRYNIKHLTRGIARPLIAVGLYMLLIFLEPDLGTAIVLFLTFLTMLCAAGARPRHVLLVSILPVLLIAARGGLRTHQMERVVVFFQQGEVPTGPGYQSFHSKLAVGSGQFTGVGWGSGREKYYLPEANSDYIFATIGEEFGLVGTSLTLLAFGLVTWCGLMIARQAVDQFGRMLAVGLTALISWQALINIAVVTVSIPATGVPLPFISYGSTSLILSLICVGLLVSIAQRPRDARPEATPA